MSGNVRLVVLIAASILGVGLLLLITPKAPVLPSINIAFVGNSVTFVNDLPRLMEALSGGRIHQNSCLHGSLNLRSILRYGNGMFEKFQSPAAAINGTYDYGLCTVPQLLLGVDENLVASNANGYYRNDGRNPCFADDDYFAHVQATWQAPAWDYIVLNDRTVYPALESKRARSLQALQDYYIDFFLATGARPVLLQTWGYTEFESSSRGETDDDSGGDDDDDDDDNVEYADAVWSDRLGNISEFTSHVAYGYQQYYDYLAAALPADQQPILAPVGLAFLTVYEENYALWQDLFFTDHLHPSPTGSYLLGLVLFAAVYGRLPPTAEGLDPRHLFSRARRMEVVTGVDPLPLPLKSTGIYLYHVVERVVLQGHQPSTLMDVATVAALEARVTDDDYNW